MRRVIVLTAAMLVVIAACGLPDEQEFRSIPRSDDGFDLWETSTTSTTTTTLLPSTTVDATTSTIAVATTIAPTELVHLYFATGQQLAPIQWPMTPDPSLQQVMLQILAGPPAGDLGRGLRPILPKSADISVTRADGIATVNLPEGIFDSMDSRDQRLVFGQIVLTMADQRGVGQVLFLLAGEPMRVFKGSGGVTEPGETVSGDDYQTLLSSDGPPIESTTTAVVI